MEESNWGQIDCNVRQARRRERAVQLDTLKLTGMLCLIGAHKFRLTPRIDALRRACLANSERAQAAKRGKC
jgi:hypothetical protein